MKYQDLALKNELLSKYSYMKVGGRADFLLIIDDCQQLIEVIKQAKRDKINFIVVGSGSNVIFSDDGFKGLVIVNRTTGISVDAINLSVIADSGSITNTVVNKSIQQGLAGLEWFFGIPGTIGGAIYNNSHYLDKCIGNLVVRVQLLKQNNQLVWENREYFKFGYDYSILQKTNEIVIQVEFKLKKGEITLLKQVATDSYERRKVTQPLEWPSSGCIFKNPKEFSAGALIDKAGLKGYTIGGAKISEKHANFIINSNNASTRDIINLIDYVKKIVKKRFGIKLIKEVFILDEKGNSDIES